MKKVEICHVCKKVKKPYIVFLTNDIFSIIHHEYAREDGPICERCDSYFAMTGEFKDATEEEFEIAKKSIWFARMMLKWWEKDYKLNFDNINCDNERTWEGTATIANWCRKESSKKQ